MKTQYQRILDYLDRRGKATIGGIQRELKINGATARISDLRKRGYAIIGVRHEGDGYITYYRGIDKYNMKDINESDEEGIPYTREEYELNEYDRMHSGGEI